MSHQPSVRFSRRQFLRSSSLAIAGATVALSGTKGHARVIGANDRINIAVAGINGRGGSHIGEYLGMKDVQITHIIDPDSRLFASRSKTIEDKGKYKVQAVQDFRKALDDPSLDAISIATTNHWHAPMSIFAVMIQRHFFQHNDVGFETLQILRNGLPLDGNLLLEVYNLSTLYPTQFFDAVNSPSDGIGHVREVLNRNDPEQSLFPTDAPSNGLVTQFVYTVPETGSLASGAAALLAAGALRRRRV